MITGMVVNMSCCSVGSCSESSAENQRPTRKDSSKRMTDSPQDSSWSPIWALPALALLMLGCASKPVPTQPRPVAIESGKCSQPPYPTEARSSGAEGTTSLSFDVDESGKVTRVAIIEASGTSQGHRLLDSLALETLKKCVFPPAPGFLPASAQVAYAWRLKE